MRFCAVLLAFVLCTIYNLNGIMFESDRQIVQMNGKYIFLDTGAEVVPGARPAVVPAEYRPAEYRLPVR